MNALILVDLQNDFVPGGALPVPDGHAVVPVANRVLRGGPAVSRPEVGGPAAGKPWDLIVATQDWHPADHGSFAASHPGRRPGDVVDLHGLSQVLWPVHCVQNTPGADFLPGLDRSRVERVFRKGTDPAIDSYSGFFDNGHRKATGLGEYLKGRGVTDVYVLGLATDYCVKFTALDAVGLGFRTHLIEDACRGVELNPGDVDAAVEAMRMKGVRVLKSGDLPGAVEGR
ncbi:MAG: Nicotinamidase [uncultured Phycisphaerae bacterium]|uniref:Nicotinamidase n=1 Tax=uncultured Phycisphaerae bacterium TaxID=904963 RepID=A0A6J4PC50_9BACT|nr:MAG: Nicotinamidase [uncultured Phycisphaerae bacterium]